MWKTAYLHGAGLAACVHWPLNSANQLVYSVSLSQPALWTKKKKKKRIQKDLTGSWIETPPTHCRI